MGKKYAQDGQKYVKNPKLLLMEACRENKETGSTTVIVITLEEDKPVIHSALIGDAGYIVLRPMDHAPGKVQIVYRSEEQQHSFNYPVQVGSIGDNPATAVVQTHQLKTGDVLVLGSDGLFDNLFDQNIIAEVESHLAREDFEASQISKKIADLAFKKSLDRYWQSPFAVNAMKSGYRMTGGKSDDITVVVGRIETQH